MTPGFFITFEGADGSGKTTQLARLAAWCREQGYQVTLTREPGGTPTAERIRSLVLEPGLTIDTKTEALLYLAARAEHVAQVIKPALEAGQIVLCDRFADSTLVYQGLTRGLGLETMTQLNAFAAGGIKPQLTFVLDGAPELLAERRAKRGVEDRFELEGLEFQQQVRAGFLTLAQAEPERIKLIEALRPVDDVTEAILQQVKAVLLHR
jgi:dTMP kinase